MLNCDSHKRFGYAELRIKQAGGKRETKYSAILVHGTFRFDIESMDITDSKFDYC